MNINPKDKMFGIPVLKVREVLRQAVKGRLWGSSRKEIIIKVAGIIKQSIETTEKLITQLLKENYIIWEKERFQEYVKFELCETDKGRRFSMAKATPLISRKKADCMLKELIERAKFINKNSELAFLVESIDVFGSFLTEKEFLGDLDVGIKLTRRYQGPQFTKHNQQRIKMAKRNGRRFNNYTDELNWSFKEVMLILKAKQRGLSLHDEEEDEVFQYTNIKEVYKFQK